MHGRCRNRHTVGQDHPSRTLAFGFSPFRFSHVVYKKHNSGGQATVLTFWKPCVFKPLDAVVDRAAVRSTD